MKNNKLFLYTAGYLDGRGSIEIACRRNQSDNYLWYPAIRFCSRSKKPLDYLNKKWQIGKLVKHKNGYEWYIYGSKCSNFLKPIIPFLKKKQEKAQILIDFLKIPYLRSTFDERRILSKKRNKLARKLHMLSQKKNIGYKHAIIQ